MKVNRIIDLNVYNLNLIYFNFQTNEDLTRDFLSILKRDFEAC